jgi:two-component system chemotaxis response regulator CheB
MNEIQARDVVVVGASAGGVEALTELVAELPKELDATVLVVLHVAAAGPSLLPKILSRAGTLPADHVRQHEELGRGRIYVAPPDQHLTVRPDGIAELTHGPRINGHRPSIDELFRSAADSYGVRVTGVVLTGALDDGSAGLAAIARAGGATLVQDPETAVYPSMPRSAAVAVPTAEMRDIESIARSIVELSEAGRPRLAVVEEVLAGVGANEEANGSKSRAEVERGDDRPGAITGFTCPECSGTLWELREGELTRFECRVGHAYSTESLLSAHGASVEAGLWAASRALYEKAALSKRLALRLQSGGSTRSAKRFEEQSREARKMADELRSLIAALSPSDVDDAVAGT